MEEWERMEHHSTKLIRIHLWKVGEWKKDKTIIPLKLTNKL